MDMLTLGNKLFDEEFNELICNRVINFIDQKDIKSLNGIIESINPELLIGVEVVRAEKFKKRGGFGQRIYLVSTRSENGDTTKNGKLVRDKIPEIIKKQGETPITYILDEESYLCELRVKLKEELREFLEIRDTVDIEHKIEELADLLEVINALEILMV
jgi:predicted house-cleaning noncanonical NTP pyrophosphatase (MazG superfamily)